MGKSGSRKISQFPLRERTWRNEWLDAYLRAQLVSRRRKRPRIAFKRPTSAVPSTSLLNVSCPCAPASCQCVAPAAAGTAATEGAARVGRRVRRCVFRCRSAEHFLQRVLHDGQAGVDGAKTRLEDGIDAQHARLVSKIRIPGQAGRPDCAEDCDDADTEANEFVSQV